MSRPGSAAGRNLSLTEELEKLEQSITLTLQEIDSNFSKAHRIVTTSILPLVEQYGEHSKSVWEASKFWKQFFEASANVSLSGYEELAADGDTTAAEETTIQDESTADYTPRAREEDATVITDQNTTYKVHEDDSLLEGDSDLTGSTPRVPSKQIAKFGSPYEELRRELNGDDQISGDESDSELLLRQHTERLPDMSMSPHSSLGTAEEEQDDNIFSTAHKNKDPLLHRVLDKNYRIQATPHKTLGVSPIKWKVSEKPQDKGKEKTLGKLPAWRDDSPMSSPEMAVPTLRSAAFMSPIKSSYRTKLAAAAIAGPRTPGVSVQTPATSKKTKDVYAEQEEQQRGRRKDETAWDSDEYDDDDDVYGGMSPPKTIQFALPASKLMQTPAREASRRIVDDILLTAGVGPDESSDYSPTMVKMNEDILDDTF